MPTLQPEQQIRAWTEESCEEVSSTPYKDSLRVAHPHVLKESVKDLPHARTYPIFYFMLHCDNEINPEQDIWDLAHAVRTKVARDVVEEYENQKLIEEINAAYDEEMEREDKEFARRMKGYYRRLFSAED